jgi:hypothetical protein
MHMTHVTGNSFDKMNVQQANQTFGHHAPRLFGVQPLLPSLDDDPDVASDSGTPTAAERRAALSFCALTTDAERTFFYIERVGDVCDQVDGDDRLLTEHRWRRQMRAVRV